MSENKKNLIVAGIVALIGIVVVMAFFFVHSEKKISIDTIDSSEKTHDISVIFINAGRADSNLILVDDKAYLIDTGLSSSVANITNVLMKYNVDKLDGVFLTHSHKDHIGGFKKISKSYEIGNVYSADISMDESDGSNAIEKAVDKSGLTLNKLKAGDRIEIADKLYLEVLGPLEYNENDDNDNSLVLRLLVNNKSIIFAGDMQFAEEATLLDAGIDVKCDVLKVGNHGNPDATSEQFATKASPEYAIITTDTSEDGDSANPRVKSYFKQVFVTMDYSNGIKVDIDKSGNILVGEA